jgi:hypothetical protein
MQLGTLIRYSNADLCLAFSSGGVILHFSKCLF